MNKLFLALLLVSSWGLQAQDASPGRYTAHNKGKFYIYWGGNRDSYSESDIHFWGKDYDFTLYEVAAEDKPKGWSIDYVNPSRLTIPQYNFRIGYFLNDHYNISFGIDHMKYVMKQAQQLQMTGVIGPGYGVPESGNSYVMTDHHQVDLTDEKFLTYEHTDGLNYVNSEFCRVDDISKFFQINNTDVFQINLTEGIGGGFLFPKTNVKLLEKERHDEFHVAGYGVSGKVGLNLTFFKHFFVQTELKCGYVNLPDVRTTYDPDDRASQHFTFVQRVIVFGGIFRL